MNIGAGALRRRLLAPEVLQASAMDCGPAALTSLLAGFDIPADYAALRHACQTDVDGTSIDRVEELASQLGLVAEQVMVPADHVLRPEAPLLPALVVVLLPGGFTHFVIAWRTIGPFVQVMDPGSGRQLVRRDALVDKLYTHEHAVPAEDWKEWAASAEFQAPLKGRLLELGAEPAAAADLMGDAVAGAGWRDLAVLDASVRFTAALAASGDVRRGSEARQAVAAFAKTARARSGLIPVPHWSAREGPEGTVLIRGALLVRIKGRRREESSAASPPVSVAGVTLPRRSVIARLRPLFRQIPRRTALVLVAAALLGSAAAALEAVLLNGLLHSGLVPLSAYGRTALIVGVAGYALFVLGLDVVSVRAALAAGRRLEAEFRLALLRKLPQIADRHLRTWLRSDLAHRAHSIAALRGVPLLVSQALRIAGEVLITAVALIVFYEGATVGALAGTILALGIPLAAYPLIADRHVRLHALEGALSIHSLDALVGGFAARAHAAEDVLRGEHAARLDDWEYAGRRLQTALVATGMIQQGAALAFAALVIVPHVVNHGAGAGLLLLVFWALRLPALGGAMAAVLEEALAQRSTIVRLLEPLDAPAEPLGGDGVDLGVDPGCALSLEGVSVVAGGHPILTDIDLTVAGGEHVAIIGASGAGKSTLLGLFLGWHAPSEGRRLVNGVPLEGAAREQLLERTAWLDPGVRLWNSSLVANILYGADPREVASAVDEARLQPLMDSLPEGGQTGLGEEGGFLSGGEGQRVRAARAFARGNVALAILDEPFRGVGRAERTRLLVSARRRWRDATLLCATHDLADTADFDRVIVLDGGRIVEMGSPAALRSAPGSRYSALLDAHADLDDIAWGAKLWRRVQMENGSVREDRG